jgi:hypothetical protein
MLIEEMEHLKLSFFAGGNIQNYKPTKPSKLEVLISSPNTKYSQKQNQDAAISTLGKS